MTGSLTQILKKYPKMNQTMPTLRPAMIEDAAQISALFKHTYGDSTHPCRNCDHIIDSMASKHDQWWLISRTDSIMGCLCIKRHDWNQAWETSYAIALPCLRAAAPGLSLRLLRLALREKPPQPFELCFYMPRTITAHQMMTHVRASVLVGYDGGQSLVQGYYEHHMFAIHPNDATPFANATPSHGPAADFPFAQYLNAALDLPSAPKAYPAACIVGPLSATQDGSFYRSYDHVSNVIMLSGHIRPNATEAEIIADLGVFLSCHPDAYHIGAYVLPDKVSLIKAMLEMGFSITAYLPAWYAEENTRYDCAMLVKRHVRCQPKNHGFDKEIKKFDMVYSELAEAYRHA